MATELNTQIEDLESSLEHIRKIAGEMGLDPYPTHFEIIPAHKMYEIGAYGLPVRFPHWTHGRAYRQMKTSYDHGLSKIYEVVINSNPALGYLLDNNPPAANKMVIAHVLAHVDFFKNNKVFAESRKDMPAAAASSAERIREYEQKEGRVEVEKFLDSALTIWEHIDPNPRNFYRLSKEEQIAAWEKEAKEDFQGKNKPKSEYDDLFNIGVDKSRDERPKKVKIPYHPDKDLLHIIREYSPILSDWQKDILDIIRGESLYFYPQMRTKIMNEGWASFWHKRIMRKMGALNLLTGKEEESWWKLHSGVLSPNPLQLNPYYLGMGMFEYLEDYYNGYISDEEKRWLERQELPVYPKFDGPIEESPGRCKIREIMIYDDDQSFIRNYFNKIVADRTKTYIYRKQETEDGTEYVIEDKNWKHLKNVFVSSMNNCGQPYLQVTDTGHFGERNLVISHVYEGVELDIEYIEKTLPHIFNLWGQPVHLETVIDDKKVVFSYDDYEGININDLD